MKTGPFKFAIIPTLVVAVLTYIFCAISNSSDDVLIILTYFILLFVVFISLFTACSVYEMEDIALDIRDRLDRLEKAMEEEKEKEQSKSSVKPKKN